MYLLTTSNSYVFDNDPRAEDTLPKDYQSAIVRLAAQRAARQKEVALESLQNPGPNACVKNQSPGVIPISPSTFGSKLLTDHLIQKREGRTGVDGIRPKSTSSHTSTPSAPSCTRCSGPNQTSRTPSELLGGTPPLREKNISRLLTESSVTSERRRTGPSSINAATRKV